MNLFWRAVGVFVLGVGLTGSARAANASTAAVPKEFWVYFGTYTGAMSKGIYRARLEVGTGRLSAVELAAESGNPAFLAVHPNGRYLYAIDEGTDPKKTPDRGVRAFALDGKSGALTLVNEQSAGGSGPCHLTVDRGGHCVLVANYGAGSVAALPLSADGRLGAATSIIQHAGSSVNPNRQKEPHAHAIDVSPDNRFALSPDLGIDHVKIYRLDAAKATLKPHRPEAAPLPPGSGPRHLAFHPNGKFVYVINELLCTMAAFSYDAARGELRDVQSVSTLPPGESVKTGYSTAEVAAHPSGKFLFGSNRGHDSIVVFAVDAASGRLSLVEHQPTRGRTPRHFAVDPTGTWLLAENQQSDSVFVFRIDPNSGHLTLVGEKIDVPSPVCAVFVPRL